MISPVGEYKHMVYGAGDAVQQTPYTLIDRDILITALFYDLSWESDKLCFAVNMEPFEF